MQDCITCVPCSCDSIVFQSHRSDSCFRERGFRKIVLHYSAMPVPLHTAERCYRATEYDL